MAETLGVVASAIAVVQLAGEVSKAVIKFKAFWQEIQDVPYHVRDLLEDIQILEPLLADVQRQFSNNDLPPEYWDAASAETSLAHCELALKTLVEVLKEIEKKVVTTKGFKRKMLAAKIMIREETVARLEKKLNRAMTMLRFARDGYTS